jgi:hypothetical protein
MYRTLNPEQIISTAEKLSRRVWARFPDSGLSGVAEELLETARAAADRCHAISRPNIPLRIGVFALLFLGLVGIISLVVTKVRLTESFWDLSTFVETSEALVGDLVFLGIGIAFLVTFETRLKRRRALTAVNELRAIAHIIDMHQLTKDPEMVMARHPATSVSPARKMTPFELNRYLDYCSEMLAILSKIAALYVQSFPDGDAVRAVDEIENLTTALSRKIWQKIMILDRYVPRPRETAGATEAENAPLPAQVAETSKSRA